MAASTTAELASAARFQIVKYINVVSITVLVIDYLMTVGREVEFVWKARWSIGKILFLLSRYPTFIDVPLVLYYSMTPQIPLDRCLTVYRVASWSTVFGIGMAEAILLLRTYAVWGRNTMLLITLISLYLIVYFFVVLILERFLQSLKYGDPPSSSVTGCYLTNSSDVLFWDFALLMLFETIILILTLFRGATRYRHSKARLVTTLYRDGSLYFVYLFLISAGNIAVIVTLPPELVDLLNTYQRVMHSVFSTRILLHLHEASSAREFSTASTTEPFHFSLSDNVPWHRTTIEFTSDYDVPQ